MATFALCDSEGDPSLALVADDNMAALQLGVDQVEGGGRILLAFTRDGHANAVVRIQGAAGTTQVSAEVSGDGVTRVQLGDQSDSESLILSGWPLGVEENLTVVGERLQELFAEAEEAQSRDQQLVTALESALNAMRRLAEG